jgi:AraC-like DNA-binding protein
VPAVGQAQLQGLLNIMNIIIRSFWVDGLIYSKRNLLSVKIEGFINEKLSENIYVEDICREFFISKNSLYRLFKEEFGVTVNEFILQKRLALAKELLAQNDSLSITEIAALCGFSDYNYFIRVFKKAVGTTPLKFKKDR